MILEYRMSAFGTKKITGDRGVQLTFPLNFQKAYDLPFEYFPSMSGSGYDVMVGTDFQSEYHAEKRMEANKRVMDGIQANKTKERKLLTGVHNYHLPKPVLGQRIYANPSNGAETLVSTRRDNGATAPFRVVEAGKEGSGSMRGGVVRSLEGQEFYKRQLERRISQLNRINAVAQGFATQLGAEYKTEDNTKTGAPNKVEFFLFLRALGDAVLEGDLSSFSFENLKRLLDLLVSFGPSMTIEDIDDARHQLDLMINSASYLTDIPDVRNAGRTKYNYAITIEFYTKQMRVFVNRMEAKINLSETEKKVLAKSLKRELFEKALRSKTPLANVDEVRAFDARVNQEAENADDEDGGDGEFDRPAVNREDDEADGMQRAPLAGRNADENRERFGRRTGVFVRGGPTWFGDVEDVRADEYEDLAPRYVAPLTLAGADPNAERVPRANPRFVFEALDEVIFSVLEPLGYSADQDEGEFINKNYSNHNDFVREVVSAMEERNFSPAQIAEAMVNSGLEVFEEYIAENAGDTGPAPIASSARSNVLPIGGLGPALYTDANEDGEADVVPVNEMAVPPANTPKRGEEGRALLKSLGLPETRDDMYKTYRSEADYRALGLKIPKQFGGPYVMREGTAVKNAKTYLIKVIKSKIASDW